MYVFALLLIVLNLVGLMVARMTKPVVLDPAFVRSFTEARTGIDLDWAQVAEESLTHHKHTIPVATATEEALCAMLGLDWNDPALDAEFDAPVIEAPVRKAWGSVENRALAAALRQAGLAYLVSNRETWLSTKYNAQIIGIALAVQHAQEDRDAEIAEYTLTHKIQPVVSSKRTMVATADLCGAMTKAGGSCKRKAAACVSH